MTEEKLRAHIRAYRRSGYFGRFLLKVHPETLYEITKFKLYHVNPQPEGVLHKYAECDIEEDCEMPQGRYELHKLSDIKKEHESTS